MTSHVAFTAIIAVACAAGCSVPTGPSREPDEYVGCATDELWRTFDETADVLSEADAPVVVAPAPGSEVPHAAFGFTWIPFAGAPADLRGDVSPTCAQWNTGFAVLHLPPISGTVYDLQLLVAGVSRHRVLTTLEGWRPSDSVWASFTGETIAIALRRMVVADNVPTAGPFVQTAVSSVMVVP